MLNQLVVQIGPREAGKRAAAVVAARTWITRIGAAGGIGVTEKNFYENPGTQDDTRVDIEIKKGTAFVP